MDKFRGVLFLLIVIIISTIAFGADPPEDEDPYAGDEGSASEGEVGIPTATTDTCPSGYTCDAGSDATADEEAVPASFTVSEDAPLTKFDNISVCLSLNLSSITPLPASKRAPPKSVRKYSSLNLATSPRSAATERRFLMVLSDFPSASQIFLTFCLQITAVESI